MRTPLDNLLNNIANLFKVKSIISIMVLAALTIGFLRTIVPVEQYVPLATAIITYFFTRKQKEGE